MTDPQKLFMIPPLLPNEAERLEILRQYNILDTAPEEAFDDIALLAAHICQTPIALITLLDSDRQWFKSKVGLSLSQTSRDISFCGHAITRPDDILVVPDALADGRFATNPLVTADPNIRFYAGAPLNMGNGHALGTLCVIDRVPRELTPEQLAALQALRRQVIAQLELRRSLTERDRVQAALQQAKAELERKVLERTAELQTAVDRLAVELAERKRAEEGIERQVQRLAALRQIDVMITASLDLRMTLNVLLDQVVTQLGVDAAAVMLFKPQMGVLEYAAGRGFRTPGIENTRRRLGEGHTGIAALERRIVSIPDLRAAGTGFLRSPLAAAEGFISYYGVPLMAKGQVAGVLEIFHRAALNPDGEWLRFLEAFAGQAAIAIDNATLFDSLQRSNSELFLAYDATIEGWSRALDLRDKETEGHTQRVTEMTLHLARAMGLNEADLVHVRRGALLHDIGKMGIPDSVLLKPGPLTEDEWVIMRQHPAYAYEMLLPIAYLRQALDIPYCHHEKWDGTGYPRGLKGEQIPLAARLFAVVDVWDALRSDRPYRQGWPEEKVLEHIRPLSGTHFDPQAVKVFLETMGAGSEYVRTGEGGGVR